ncbi:MAG: glycosyltransferase family 4 protein [Alphaproteobacteria bacterium]|nr:glycosyltransferase family 4 protein [Alphaproteobacteria bacterium]
MARAQLSKLIYLVADDRYFCTHRLPLAAAAQQQGFDVHVICPQGDSCEKIIHAGLTFHPLPFNRKSLNPFDGIKTVSLIYKLYKQLKPDCVHHVAIKPVLFGTIAARLAGVPKIVNAVAGLGHVFASRSWLIFPLRIMMHGLLRSPHVKIIVQNPEDQIELESLAQKPVRLIYGAGVDTDQFSPPVAVLPEKPIIITHASRLLWSKGVGELVSAARILREQGHSILVQIVGEPDMQNPDAIPADALQAWHDEGVINWLGYQSDMAAIYHKSHIAVLASYYREGIPKTLIEAASVGIPIVTTDMPGCRIIVEHEVNGLLVAPRDASGLAKALAKLINSPEMRKSFGEAGRAHVLEQFASSIIYEQTIALYK